MYCECFHCSKSGLGSKRWLMLNHEDENVFFAILQDGRIPVLHGSQSNIFELKYGQHAIKLQPVQSYLLN